VGACGREHRARAWNAVTIVNGTRRFCIGVAQGREGKKDAAQDPRMGHPLQAFGVAGPSFMKKNEASIIVKAHQLEGAACSDRTIDADGCCIWWTIAFQGCSVRTFE
jgi:hypothetical protein